MQPLHRRGGGALQVCLHWVQGESGGRFCALEVLLWGGSGFLGCEGGGWGFFGAVVIVFLGFSIVFSFLIRFFPLYYW